MHIEADSLDDLLRAVFSKIREEGIHAVPTRGPITEILGAALTLKNPRARLSRTETKGKLFSALGELFWYLSGDNDLDFIKYYVPEYENDAIEDDDGRKIIYGGYGPRLLGMRGNDQVANIIDLLRSKPDTRKAVIQIFDADDVASGQPEIPCTCTLQFFNRNNQLHMCTHMRSNDAFWGLPHDVFTFTMLQEIIARALGIDVGKYHHFVGSLHIYEEHEKKVQEFFNEGWHSTASMPEMPKGNPWKNIDTVMGIEQKIRTQSDPILPPQDLPPYWADIVFLLNIYKHRNDKQMTSFFTNISNPIYKIYAAPYLSKKRKKLSGEPSLPFSEPSKEANETKA